MGFTAFSDYVNTLLLNIKNYLIASLLRANASEHSHMDSAILDAFSYLNYHETHLHTYIEQTYYRLSDVAARHTNKKSNLRNGDQQI